MTAVLPIPDNFLTAERLVLREDFNRLPGINADIGIAYNLDFELLGTSAVSADLAFNAAGGFDLATHGGATDSAILLPHLDSAQSRWSGITWLPSRQPNFMLNMKTDSALTNTTIWAGFKLTNTPVSTTDNDIAFFRYQNGTDTNWQCVWDVANAGPTSSDSGVAVAASTVYRLWITINSAGLATFWINGVAVYTTTALTSTAAFIPYVGVLSATTATVKKIIVRNLSCSIAVS